MPLRSHPRAARGGGACGLVGSIVLHAAFSPTAALLLLLVASLLAICFVLHCCCGTRLCPAKAPWLLLAGAAACPSLTAPSWCTWPSPARSTRSCSSARSVCRLACTPTAPCCTRTCGVLGLRSWPACSTHGERPHRDLSLGVRIVNAGSELPRRAAPADERCCRCCAAGRVERGRLLVVAL